MEVERPSETNVTRHAELWVETEGFGRCRLTGNAHTFPGRISAWSETLATWVTISRSDVRRESADASAWLDGFLAGNEPELHEFLGINADQASELSDDDPAVARYQDALDHFRRSGAMPFLLNPRPTLPPPHDLPVEPWAAVAGEVLRWNGSAWMPRVHQPELHFELLAGTVCDQRGHHDMEVVSEQHVVCRDCGCLAETAEEK